MMRRQDIRLIQIFYLIACALLFSCPVPAFAEEAGNPKDGEARGSNIYAVIDDAQKRAASYFKVPVALLNAIKRHESGGHPWALCINLSSGKYYSVFPKSYQEAVYYLATLKTDNIDIGPWQVNYHHLGKKAGISKMQMLNPYVSGYLAAYKLSSEIAENGYTWHAVGNYHSRNLQRKIAYIKDIKAQLRKDGYKIQ